MRVRSPGSARGLARLGPHRKAVLVDTVLTDPQSQAEFRLLGPGEPRQLAPWEPARREGALQRAPRPVERVPPPLLNSAGLKQVTGPAHSRGRPFQEVGASGPTVVPVWDSFPVLSAGGE